MASAPGGVLTWRAGPPRGCDATLRPRGRAVGGPCEAQEAHKARPRGRRPRVHAGPRGHAGPCGRPCGRHVAGEGRHMEGPRVSGPW